MDVNEPVTEEHVSQIFNRLQQNTSDNSQRRAATATDMKRLINLEVNLRFLCDEMMEDEEDASFCAGISLCLFL